MRTTLTIDDDVAVMLNRLRREQDANLKEIVNEALRRGLQQMNARPKRRGRFATRAVSLGRPLVGAIDNIAEALALAEDDALR